MKRALCTWCLQVRSHADLMGKLTDESRQNSSALESLKRKAVETEKELSSNKAALEAAYKAIEDRGRKTAEAQSELEKER